MHCVPDLDIKFTQEVVAGVQDLRILTGAHLQKLNGPPRHPGGPS